MRVFPHYSSYPLTIHVGRKEGGREWEKQEERISRKQMNGLAPEQFSFRRNILGKRELKLSLCLPDLSHCSAVRWCSRLREGTQNGGISTLALCLSVCSLFQASSAPRDGVLGWDHTLACQSLVAPGPELSLSRPKVSSLDHMK